MKTRLPSVVLIAAGLLTCAGSLSQSASAQSQVARAGTIARTFVSGGGNYAFRVYIYDGANDQLSDCNYSFAYMNVSDDNYQAKAAFFLTSYIQHQRVSVSFVKDANGFCQITEAND